MQRHWYGPCGKYLTRTSFPYFIISRSILTSLIGPLKLSENRSRNISNMIAILVIGNDV